MRLNRRVFGWGVFFLVVGLVPLAIQAGLIDEATVRRAWRLWPLILIGIGLGIVLERTAAAMIGSLIVAVTFGLMVGSVLAVGFGPVAGIGSCGFGMGIGGNQPFPAQTGSLAASSNVALDVSCGELTATTASGSDWRVAGSTGSGTTPRIDTAASRLSVRWPPSGGFSSAGSADLKLTLPADPATTLSATINAGSARLQLGDAHVTGVELSVNAGAAHVDLSSAVGTSSVNASVNAGSLGLSLPAPDGLLAGSLSANAGSINVCVPDGVALQIHSSSSLGSNNFGSQGLTRTNDVWSNQLPGLSADRIELTTSANLGSITLNPEGGCE